MMSDFDGNLSELEKDIRWVILTSDKEAIRYFCVLESYMECFKYQTREEFISFYGTTPEEQFIRLYNHWIFEVDETKVLDEASKQWQWLNILMWPDEYKNIQGIKDEMKDVFDVCKNGLY
jgi:hypothetical protein